MINATNPAKPGLTITERVNVSTATAPIAVIKQVLNDVLLALQTLAEIIIGSTVRLITITKNNKKLIT